MDVVCGLDADDTQKVNNKEVGFYNVTVSS